MINSEASVHEKFIDIEKVIASKNPKLLKIIPWFVLRYLKRIIHLDEMNDVLERNRNTIGFDFADAIIKEFNIKVEVVGLENVPPTGNQFLISNHPLGGLDGIALFHCIRKIREDVKFPVNDLLMNLPQMVPLFIPINKHGRNTENIAILEKAFASSDMLMFFPAGLVSRKQNGKILDLEWKHTFISKAIKYQRDIVPCYVEAVNSSFFYNLALWRKRLGIKVNIEMLYLVDELYKFKNKSIKIYFGKPISYSSLDKSKSAKEWATWYKKLVETRSFEM